MMIHRTRRNAILYGLIALFLLTAYGAGVAALAVWLARRMTPVAALGSVAGLALLLVLIIVLVVAVKNKADERKRREAAANNRALMMTTAVSLLPVMMKSRPLMAAAVTGGVALFALRMLGGGRDAGDPPDA
ncbi:hypothetical protein [Rhizobium sp. SSA_523]|uniref:hypothetical protein n=1 Tax=Rhizobium sp. SSA_523 TaxID=2952477 RepID=UPI0020913CA5|nr:hypothetical protein [Rhizobium sp. SSA_523]MCO5731772.1 hypothetical protein [Rhizobium sp. SSA_523]WKC22858.1 hypothetical protein QTJ18_18675 [Rhizobium sp. SSA_523]